MKTEKLLRLGRAVLLCAVMLCTAPIVTSAQAVNDLLIQLLSYDYNCSTGMATVKYHITNSDASGHVGGYNTSYTINLGVYSTSGFIGNGDDDVEFTGGYIIGDMIECRAWGVGNNFTYPMTFDYVGYLPRPAKPYIFPFASSVTTCNGQPVTLYAHNATGNPATFIWSNGQTGETISVTTPGTYTVQEAGSCANSDPSDPITVVVNNGPSAPVITSMNGSSLCNGGSTVLSASSSGGTIHWNTGETGSSISVSSPGSYYAWEENGCGNSGNSNTITLTAINTSDIPVIVSSNGTFLCNGTTTTLSATPAHGGTVYWNTGETGNSITVSAAGNYYAYEGTPCGTSNYSNTITISTASTPAAPTIATNNSSLLCDGATATIFVPSPGGTINWNTGETGSSITVGPGSYYATASNGCGTSGNSNTISFTSGNTPAPPAITPAGPLQICNGGSVVLSIPGGGNTNWYKDGGLLAVNAGTQSVNAPGSYTATLNNACGVSGQSSAVIVTSGGSPAAPSVSANGTIVCNGSPVTLTASGSGTIHWNTGETGSSISVSTAGTYYAYAENSCGNSSNSNAIVLTAGSTPPAPSLNVTGAVTLCDGASQTITASPSAGGTIYWSNGATGNSITVNSSGSYYAYESNSCGNGPNSASVNITTLSKPVSPSVTPPGSQLLCNGQTATLSASGSNITWNNGTTGNTLVTGTAGTYYAYANNYCGNSPNSNAVVITTGNCPMPSPGTSFFICPGALKTLDAGAGYDTYLWSNGATTRAVAVGPGNYAVTVSKEGCYATSVTVTVSYYSVSVPSVNASGPTTFCAGNSVTLSSSPAAAYAWSNGATSNTINVTTSGSFYVTITDGNGCQATSASTTVTVNPLPTASIGGTTAVCKNTASPSVTFNASGGTAPYTFSYNIDGGSTQTITTSTNSISLSVPTATAGTFTYNLLGVQESSSTSCYNPASGTATITVNELPGATIAGDNTVCLNSSSPFVTFTGNTGTAPYTFTYSINGGANQTVTTTSGNSVSVAAPTITAGTYTYSLISVQEASGLTCANAVSGNATVVVRPLPTASITGSTTVCQNSINPLINFTGAVGNAPYTFTYNINGAAAQTVTTVSGNAVSLNVPTNTAGVFTYNLISVQESGTGSCVNTASGSATVTVNPLPLATIAGSVTVCQNNTQPAITFTGNNATAPYTFTYKINGGTNQTVTTTSGNSVSVNVPTDVAGTFVYELVSVTDAGSTACTNTASGTATVIVRSLPTATVAGTTSVCNNSTAPLITFTGAVGNAPYTFTYNINGGANQTATTTSGNSVTVEAPTNAVGSFVYNLVGVQESGTPSCISAVTGSATITVNPLPSAAIAGSVTVCQNSTQPLITFTGSNAIAPYTFTYHINGGTDQTVTTTSGNSVTVAVPTNVPGTFTYTLVSVQESSGTTCANTATGSAIVVINPQPAAAVLLAPNAHLCNGETGQLTIYNWTEGFTYRWYKDGVLFATGTGQTMPITQAGTYTVMVTSDLGCDAAAISNPVIITTGSIPTPIITGSLKVCEGGKTSLTVLSPDKRMDYELYRWTDTPIGDSLGNEKSFSAFAGQYRLRVEREGCYDSVSVVVTANDTEYPAGRITVTPDSIAYGGQVRIKADISGASEYHWDFGNDRKIVSANSTMLQNYFMRADSVEIKVQAVSERNCRTDFSALLKIGRPDTLVFADRSFTGNLKDWNLFPVPFHDELKLSVILKHNETIRMDLFAYDGSWLRSWQFSGKKGENLFRVNNTEGLPSGVLYLVTAYYNGEKHFDKIYKY